MDEMTKLLNDTKKLMMLRYPRFGSEIASANIAFKNDLKHHTAATDGKNIYFDPDYLTNLSESDRLFVLAHELMHIKFAHVFRLKDKNGENRDPYIWNIATDAIINANLERDGFTIKDGYVNRPDALNYSAEELYQIILDEKVEKDSSNQDNQSSSDMDNENQQSGDDHTLWKEAFEQRENNNESKLDDFSTQSFNEKEEFEFNREERIAKAKANLKQMKDDLLSKSDFLGKTNLGPVGNSVEELDWKLLLRREIEKTENIWSQRRSIAENNYAYRLEENDIDEDAETEVMIDVSGSISLNLVKGFLRMLKPALKESKLKVGCFNERFWGMTDIRSLSDIDNFEIPRAARGNSARTEDWDLAVRSFSKRNEVNKIVFTDGISSPENMPKQDLKNENVIWLVYGNKNFKPCCGTVIQIPQKQLEILNMCQTNYEESGKTK